jgi:predicted membrane-bound spermidine synthase
VSPRNLLILVAFEGFASLAFEVIALRRIIPYVGSSITVTAPTIAIFLAALALGYFAASRVRENYERTVLRNFLIAAVIGGCMLSERGAALVFGLIPSPVVALPVYLIASMAPPAYFLAQTVPVLSNILGKARVGEAGGLALAWSTFGSVFGALGLSLVVMQHLGVSAALLLTALGLLVAAAWAALRMGQRRVLVAIAACAVPIIAVNTLPRLGVADTAYADYAVVPVFPPMGGMPPARAFMVNNQYASLLDSSEPPKRWPYLDYMALQITDVHRFVGRDVLVLGAGGFALSIDDPLNAYTYVDIDPKIRGIAEQHFLGTPENPGAINGRFIADDARSYVLKTTERYDAIAVDVFSSHFTVPPQLVTVEFWSSLRPRLKPDGVVLINLILDPTLRDAYARNAIASVEAALGRCAVHVVHPREPRSNVVLSCRPGDAPPPLVRLYTDDRNAVDWDRQILGG